LPKQVVLEGQKIKLSDIQNPVVFSLNIKLKDEKDLANEYEIIIKVMRPNSSENESALYDYWSDSA
jgi:hypothetical protein